MNLVFFSQHFFPETFRINDIVFGLSKKYKISVFTGRPNYHTGKISKKNKGLFLKKEKINKVDIYRFPITSRGNNNFSRILNYLSYILSASFFSIFIKKKTDIVFVYATSPIFQVIPAIIFSWKNNAKLIFWVQDLWPETLQDLKIIKNKYLIFILNKIINFLYNFAYLILVPSKSLKEKIFNKIVKRNIKILYNPSNVNFKSNNIFKKKNKKTLITFSGNIGKAQEFKTLLKALSLNLINENICFNIIGNGSELKNLKINFKNFIKSKKVKFLNYLTHSHLNKILASSDALYITLDKGLSYDRIIPGKFSTYLSFGKPIIGSCNGELYNIIKKNNIGFVSKTGSYKKLANNINKISKLSQIKKKNIYTSSKSLLNKKFDLQNNLTLLETYFKY